ncbi:MAG: hypothetical protein ACLFPE_12765 [Bacteroidales bacterium]
MKDTTITEIVTFRVPETVTDEQVLDGAGALLEFQSRLDGFIDAELVKENSGHAWCFVYHFQSMEKADAMRPELMRSKPLEKLVSLAVPGSLQVVFYRQMKKW